jgi:YggT family protein
MNQALDVLRWVVLAAVATTVAAGAAAMAVQRRVLNPFGRPARAIRDATDPFLKPIERRLLRSGGNPQNAPWWLIGAAIVGGILTITLAQWLLAQVSAALHAAQYGGRGVLWLLVDWTFGLLILALIVRVIGSWLGATRWTTWMRPFHWLTEWFLRPLRQVIPPFGPFDLSPLVAWLILMLLRSQVLGIL